MNKEQKIIEMFEKGILLNEEVLENDIDGNLLEKIETESDLIVLNSDYVDVIKQESSLVDWYEVDKLRVDFEKLRDDDLYQSQLQNFQNSTLIIESSQNDQIIQKQEITNLEIELDNNPQQSCETEFTTEIAKEEINKELSPVSLEIEKESLQIVQQDVSIIISYENKSKKFEVKDFANFFISRFKFLEGILRNRIELQNTLTIRRISDKKEREKVSAIGIVEEIAETRNGNIILTIEDLTGTIKVLVSKNNPELYLQAKDIVPDEVIGIFGSCGDKIIFSEKIIWPDIPLNNPLKKGPKEELVIFLSDIHVGSKQFLKDSFEKFIKWIRGEVGNEKQREMANKVKYIFIAGDLVDGVGIYPGHEEDLEITQIEKQYDEFARLISKIPSTIPIIICPGNHDVVHLAEPQPVFYKEFVTGLLDLPNVTLVSNPSLINIGKTENFPGFDIQMYHGYSFDYYVANVESIRNGGGYKRADLIMKFLLKRRHLAPSFTSTPYYPVHKEDPLLIKKIPDILITGHIHYCSVANYKGITMISGSCWQGKTSFQEKLGHEPEPGRVPIVNLKTREVKILRF